MEIQEFLEPDSVINIRASSKKQLLQELAKASTRIINHDEGKIFDTLLERERLGSTGVGKGVAIPHAKLSGLNSLQGVFSRLDKPVDFESVDGYPVDLIFLLLAPLEANADHLKALAKVSRLLRNTDFCEKLRGASNSEGLYILLTQSEAEAA